MGDIKLYSVTLVKGYSYTEAGGRTFYQNRPLRIQLTEADKERLALMEGGTKFQIVEIASAPKPAPSAAAPPEPTVDDASDDEEVDDDEYEEIDFAKMTKAEIKEYLDEHDVEYDDRMTKAELIELAEAI